MPVLRESFKGEVRPLRFVRQFERAVGLKFSHVCIVAAALAAMYVATESYSNDTGYSPRSGYAPPSNSAATQPR